MTSVVRVRRRRPKVPTPSVRKPGERCACSVQGLVQWELRAPGAPLRRVCSDCAERAPLGAHLRRVSA